MSFLGLKLKKNDLIVDYVYDTYLYHYWSYSLFKLNLIVKSNTKMKDLTPKKTNKSPTFESIKQKYTQKLSNTSRSPSKNYTSGTGNQEVYSARSVTQPLHIINSNVSPFKLKETREIYKDYQSGGKPEFDLNIIRQRINQNSENIVKAECLTDRIHSQRAFNKVSIEQTKRALLRQHL